jgi:ankyrin repeat protein
MAAVENDAAMVKVLLAAGASTAAVSTVGHLPLHEACWHGESCDIQIIKQLVSSGPHLLNIYSKHTSGSSSVTPLLAAVSRGCSTEVANVLIASGADIDATDIQGTPVLRYAEEVSMVGLLLGAGAAVNARDSIGSTVLHSAAQRGSSTGVICCLLKADADTTATDTTGSTPAEVALAFGHTATAALLQRAEADQRSKQQQQQQQQQQQCAVALPADRQILNG